MKGNANHPQFQLLCVSGEVGAIQLRLQGLDAMLMICIVIVSHFRVLADVIDHSAKNLVEMCHFAP